MDKNRISAFSLLLLSVPALAQGATTINGVTYGDKPAGTPMAASTLPPEQALRLKKLFLFPSIDDLSGALSPMLDEKLVGLFAKNTRFELVRDPQVVKALSPDESAYYKAAQSPAVHKEAARVVGADTTALLRTRNLGQNTQMTLELRDSNGDMLFSEEGSVPGSAKLEARWDLIENLYMKILAKFPFEGTVTGRVANTLTIDLGAGAVKQGEEIEAARIVSVQRHPLLGTVIGTDYVRTGRARVTTVDKVLSFAEVQDEIRGEKIAPGQKILLARATISRKAVFEEGKEAPSPQGVTEHSGPPKRQAEEDPLADRIQGDFDRPKARYGHLGGNILYGSVSQTQTTGGNSAAFGGSGIGGEFEGELWVTKSWIASLAYGFHNATLTGSGNAAVGDTSWSRFGFFVGYRLFPDTFSSGLALTGSLGYQTMNFAIPENLALNVGGKKYSGVAIRAEGEMGFAEGQKINAGFSILPFANFVEGGGALGVAKGGTVIGLHLAWSHQLMSEIWLRIGTRYDVANGSYETSGSSVSNKRFAIGPGIYYLF